MQYGNFDINLLRTLDALFTERERHAAAEQLCISQSAMSGALQRLRDYFKDQIMVRVGHDMVLTPLGESLVDPVRAALLQIQATLASRPSFDPGESRRSFTIAMSDYGSFVIMPRLLRRLAAEAPRITCHIEPLAGETFDRIEAGDLDLLVSVASCEEILRPGASQDIKMRKLDIDDFVCVVDENHAGIGDGLTLRQYEAMPHLLVRFGANLDTLVEKAWKRDGLDMNVVAVTPSFFSMLFMLPGTGMVATVQRRFAEALAPSLGLKIVECPVDIGGLQQILMWHAKNDLDPGHQYLRRMIVDPINSLRGPRDSALPAPQRPQADAEYVLAG